MKLPNFIIAGAQKSASTFVQECLRQHPDVFMPYGETAFFESPEYENENISDFFSLFENSRNKVCGIKRPNYLGRQEVAGRIYKHLPDVKIILILRNPAERAVSGYFHSMNYGEIPLLDINEGLNNVIDGKYDDKYQRAKDIINFGFYFTQIQQYLQFFGKSQLLIVLHDDVCFAPFETLKTVFQFIGVDADFRPVINGLRPQSVVYNISRLRLIRLRNHFMFRYNSTLTRFWIKDRNFFGKVVYYAITAIDRFILSKVFNNRKPSLSNSLKHRLDNIYSNDIKSLEAFINRDLSGWRAS